MRKSYLLFFLLLSSFFLQSQTVPNGRYIGSMLVCNDGFRNVAGRCQKLPAVTNGRYIGSMLVCNDGYKNVGGKCNKMTPQEAEQQRIQMAIIAARARAANKEFFVDGEKFTLRDISRKCEVWRWSDNYGDVECRGSEFRIIERKCEAYFSGKYEKSGELECRGSDLRPIERYCSTTMYSDNYGDIDC